MADYTLRIVIQGQDKASSVLGGVTAALGRLGEITGGLLLAGGISRLAGSLQGLAGEALDAYADFERLGMTLQSLLAVEQMNVTAGLSLSRAMEQTAGQARELVAWAQRLAIFSPFTEETVTQTLQTAMGYGMASRMAQDLTEALVNYAAGTGRSNEQAKLLGLALGQVWAKGKLTGEEMRQLTNAGLGVGVVARALGMDVATLADRMEKGKITAQELIPAFIALTNKEFPDAARRQATAWAGLLSTLSDLKRIGLRTFFESTFQAIQPYVTQFVDTFATPEFMDRLSRMGRTLGGVVADGLRRVADLLGAFQRGGVRGILTTLGIDSETVGFVQRMIGDVTALASTVRSGLGTALEWVSANILPALGAALQFVMDHWEAFRNALIAVGAVLVGATVLGAIASVGAAIAALANPITLIIAAVAVLAMAWTENWGGIRTHVEEAWGVIQPLLAQLYSWLSVTIPQAMAFLQGVVNAGLSVMREWWTQHGDSVMTILNVLWSNIRAVVRTGVDLVQAIITKALAVWQTFWETHGETIGALWAAVWNDLRILVETAVAIISSVIDAFAAALEGDWAAFGEHLRAIWDAAWAAIRTIITTTAPALLNAISLLVADIIGAFQNVDWAAIGRGIIDGITAGVISVATALAQAVARAALEALRAAKRALGIESPSRAFAEVGQNMMLGMALGIQKWADLPQLQVRSVSQALPQVGSTRGFMAPVYVTLNVDRVGSDLDVEALAWRVANVIVRRAR